jgi:hypothetical protein
MTGCTDLECKVPLHPRLYGLGCKEDLALRTVKPTQAVTILALT